MGSCRRNQPQSHFLHSMDAFKGKYERSSAENYEEFLKALDVSYLLRKAATVSTPVMEETAPDGRDVKAVVNFEGGKLVTVQKAKKSGQKSTRSVREMNGADEMIYTMTIEGNDSLVCVQKFKRI